MKNQAPFVFAGLWNGRKDPATDQWLCTCTIVTGPPNSLVAQIHTRMPVILPFEHHPVWFGETDDGDLRELLQPCPAE
jgi:putative SOS response-associated peptidase YedK